MTSQRFVLLAGVVAGLAAVAVLPWHAAGSEGAVALAAAGRVTALVPLLLLALAGGLAAAAPRQGLALLFVAVAGACSILFSWGGLVQSAFALPLPDGWAGQPAIGPGAILAVVTFLALASIGLARHGLMDGEPFGNALLVFVAALLFLFILMPLGMVFAVVLAPGADGSFISGFLGRISGRDIWGLDCVAGGGRCGMVWNSIALGVVVATSCTLLGLAAALFVARTRLRGRGAIRLLTLLPLVTPPFVVGLALILLFGRSGTLTVIGADLLGIRPTRWIYGLQGVWLAQTLGLSPLAFMVIHSVLISVSPSVEEAASTLRASPWHTFRTVTLPLIRPGIASAFLLCFIDSMADLGNPLIIGGGYQVLASGIYFKIVGAQSDLGAAAGLGIILLAISLIAFVLQTYWLRGASYVTVTGKGDGGRNAALPPQVRGPVIGATVLWVGLIVMIYGTVLLGGFAEIWGRNYTPTLRHFVQAFGVSAGEHGLVWSGGAWNSFSTTLVISAIAAPVTAALGLLTAYLIARRQFAGRQLFEFLAMLSFAMPGTVVGLAFVLAFNSAPVEMTGTAMILFFAFISRNMPVGVRVGLAQLSQIDRSLDEASLTLGASNSGTLRRVLFPLLRPAIATAIIYAFVAAVTTLSQVIFLVSPRYDWATTYIVSLVENTNYGPAIAYSVILILLLVAVIGILQAVLPQAVIRRRGNAPSPVTPPPHP
jgi:iron(III) transport system permease protein